jgi:hypothetical protein
MNLEWLRKRTQRWVIDVAYPAHRYTKKYEDNILYVVGTQGTIMGKHKNQNERELQFRVRGDERARTIALRIALLLDISNAERALREYSIAYRETPETVYVNMYKAPRRGYKDLEPYIKAAHENAGGTKNG